MNRASETIGAIAAALASDLDAPDLDARPGPAGAPNGEESFSASSANRSKPARNERQARRSTLATAVPAPLRDQLSAVLREQLLCELAAIFGPDEAAEWARKTLPAKNTLTGGDARLVEEAFARRLASFEEGDATAGVSAQALALVPGGPHIPLSEPPTEPASIDKTKCT